MKVNMLRSVVILVFSITLFYSCNIIPALYVLGFVILFSKAYTAEEAKIEIRNANQEIIAEKDEMFNTSGFGSLQYLLELMSSDDMKSKRINSEIFHSQLTYTKALNYFRGENALKSSKLDDTFYGILQYNFMSGEMEKIADSDDMLQMQYPANETAKIQQQLNAVLTISDLEFEEITS